ncbi:MAG: hypothetical protein A4S09_10920 [Proteobacteria bacterium SG_bin7]|nr:MAG: hypothetical protein A4S09_10920 [Proteobacteria bacterium SG_bin7]
MKCESNLNTGDFSLIIPAVISKDPSKNSEAVFINGYLTSCERIDSKKVELNCEWFTSGGQANKGPVSFNLSLVKKPKSKEKDIQIYGAWKNLENSIQGQWKGIKE